MSFDEQYDQHDQYTVLGFWPSEPESAVYFEIPSLAH